VPVDDDEGQILFDRLPAELGIVAPVCARLWDQFYAGPRLGGADITQLRIELQAIEAGVSAGRAALRRRAPDLEVFLAKSAVLTRLAQLLALCDDAMALAGGIECQGD
jgi:hypothetical protein